MHARTPRGPASNVAVALVLFLCGPLAACEREVPSALSSTATSAEIAEQYDALGVFEIDQGDAHYRVLYWDEPDRAYMLVLYRLDGGSFRRVGHELHLVGSEVPTLVGSQVHARQLANDMVIVHRVAGDDFELVLGADFGSARSELRGRIELLELSRRRSSNSSIRPPVERPAPS